MKKITCAFCGKEFANGDNIVSLVAAQPNVHHHLKCVLDAAVKETRETCAKLVENFPATPKERAFRKEAAALIRGQP